MPDVKDLYETVTRQAPPQPDPLPRQHARQRRAVRNRRVGAIGMTVVLILGLAWLARPPSGQRDPVPAVVTEPGGLFSLDIETGSLTPFHDPGEDTHSFELSPDGTRLLMSYENMVTHGNYQLWIANADGTDAEVLVGDDAQWGTWFPDGQRIAFSGLGDQGADTRQIQILDLQTGELRQVTEEPMDAFDPEVTPDGTAIIYSTTRPSVVEPVGEPTANAPGPPPVSLLRRVELASGITTTLFREEAGWLYLADVSPASGDIAFGRWESDYLSNEPRQQEILMIEPGGGSRVFLGRDLDAGRAFVDFPVWSPDGSQLAYMIEDANGVQTVWIHDEATDGDRPVGPGRPETWLDEDTLLVAT